MESRCSRHWDRCSAGKALTDGLAATSIGLVVKKLVGTGRVGRISQPEERRDWKRVLLLVHYEANQDFWTDWRLVGYDYEPLLEALIRCKHRHPWVASNDDEQAWIGLTRAIEYRPVAYGGRSPGDPPQVRNSRNFHLRRYSDRVRDFAARWGLRCDWAPAWIHASYLEWIRLIAPRELVEALWENLPPGLQRALKDSLAKMPTQRDLRGRLRKALRTGAELEGQPSLVRAAERRTFDFSSTLLEKRWERLGRVRLRNLRVGPAAWMPDSGIKIDVGYEPWPNDEWADVEARIVAEARRQRDLIRQAYREAGFVHWDKEPQIKEHVRWLYLRICPPQDGGRTPSWNAIAASQPVPVSERVNWRTVKWAVERLADEMGIELPKVPRGRPRKLADK